MFYLTRSCSSTYVVIKALLLSLLLLLLLLLFFFIIIIFIITIISEYFYRIKVSVLSVKNCYQHLKRGEIYFTKKCNE